MNKCTVYVGGCDVYVEAEEEDLGDDEAEVRREAWRGFGEGAWG